MSLLSGRQGVSSRLAGGLLAVAMACVLGPGVAEAKKGKPKPLPVSCPGGRFLLAKPVTAGGVTIDAIVVDGGQTTIPGCQATAAALRAGKRATAVKVVWASCAGLGGGATFKGKMTSSCQVLRGKLVVKAAKKVKSAVTAKLSRCGDGVLDPSTGEQCDPNGCGTDQVCQTESCTCALPVKTTYDVTYAPATTVIEPAEVEAHFRRREEARYVFGTGATAVGALTPGRVVIFGGLALRKVTQVQTVGDEILVDTESAKLTDAITDGTIAWQSPVLLDEAGARRALAYQGSAVAVAAAADDGMRLAAAGPALSYTGQIAGVDVSLMLTPSAGRLDIEGTFTYGETARFAASATGFIRGLQSSGQIDVHDSTVSDLSMETSGIDGEITLKIAAVRLNSDGFKLPIPLSFPVPIQIGPIPVLLKLSANATIVPVLEGESSSDLEFKIKFNAGQGVKVEGGVVKPFGALNNQVITQTAASTAGFVPVGIGFGLEFPRLEIGILGNVVVPYMTTITSVRGYFTPLLVAPCLDAGMSIRGVVGYQLGFLGVSATAEKELFKKERFTHSDSNGVGEGECP